MIFDGFDQENYFYFKFVRNAWDETCFFILQFSISFQNVLTTTSATSAASLFSFQDYNDHQMIKKVTKADILKLVLNSMDHSYLPKPLNSCFLFLLSYTKQDQWTQSRHFLRCYQTPLNFDYYLVTNHYFHWTNDFEMSDITYQT